MNNAQQSPTVLGKGELDESIYLTRNPEITDTQEMWREREK